MQQEQNPITPYGQSNDTKFVAMSVILMGLRDTQQ